MADSVLETNEESEVALPEKISLYGKDGKLIHALPAEGNDLASVLIHAYENGISLAGVQLEGLRLGFKDLQGLDLSNSNIKDCDFRAAKLDATNFSGAEISGTCFYGAQVKGANFDGATITKSEFCHANIDEATFTQTRLNNCQLNDEYTSRPVPAAAIVNGIDLAVLMRPENMLDTQKFKEDCIVARSAHISAADTIFSVPKESFSAEEITRMAKGQFSDIKMVDLEQAGGQYRDEPCRLGMGISGEPLVQFKLAGHVSMSQDKNYQLTPKENDLLAQGRAVFISAAYTPNKTLETPMQWMQIDKELNRIVVLNKNELALPDKMLGKDITPHHQELKDTGAAQVDGLQAKNGKTFSALVEVDLIRGKLRISPDLSLTKSKREESTLGQTEGKAKAAAPVQKSSPALILQVPEAETEKEVRRGGPRR